MKVNEENENETKDNTKIVESVQPKIIESDAPEVVGDLEIELN